MRNCKDERKIATTCLEITNHIQHNSLYLSINYLPHSPLLILLRLAAVAVTFTLVCYEWNEN